MPSYYEALPIYKVAMDVAVRVDAVVQRFAKGHSTPSVGVYGKQPWTLSCSSRGVTAAPSERDSFRCFAIVSKS